LDARGHAYVRTGEQAAKVKRIRNDPRVKLAPCTVRGKPLGPYAQGTARVVTPEEVGDAEQAIQENYGLGRTLYERSAASFEAHYIEVVPT
jgi:PPOX class probable F420-dependent enzyme